MKKQLALVLALLLMLSVFGTALAGTSAEGTHYTGSYGTTVKDFKFIKMEDGIGCGVCPVYSAPSLDAYRCNNGKAACATDYEMYIGGFEENGWLMVRYTTGNDKYSTRVGYIPASYVRSFNHWSRTDFAHIAKTASTYLYVTDNPLQKYNEEYFAILEPGETYYVLAEYTYHGNWWYIECDVDGQVARGFITK